MNYTREQVEKEVLTRLREIVKIVKEYAPESDFIDLTMCDNRISIFNDYFEKHVEHPIRADAILTDTGITRITHWDIPDEEEE